MLNMLPKLALVAMKTYFSVLAKVDPPLPDALDEDAQVLLQQDDVGRLLGDVHGLVDRDADVGACRAEASLIPSPR